MAVNCPAELVATLLGRIQWNGRSDPWSLADLRISDADFDAIQTCFRSLSRARVDEAFRGLAGPVTISEQVIGGQSVLGLFFLLVFAETARRQATEGSLWASVRSTLGINSAVSDLMFDAGGQPVGPLKLALERAARRFGLRHAFDLPLDEGPGHQWYTTVFLQFGFTMRGFARNAPHWMRNINLPKAVRLLLTHEALAAGQPRLNSGTFIDLWRVLRLVARRVVADDEARRRLGASPWVPPGRGEGLLDAIRREDWSDLNEASLDSHDATQGVVSDTFVGRHWWRYRDGRLEVHAELSGLSTLDLSQQFYDIFVDGRRVGRLLRSGDALRLIGREYIVDASAFVIRVPGPFRPSVAASLVDPAGVSRAEQSLALWDSEGPVSIIAPSDDSSRMLSLADPLPNSGHIFVVADAACRIAPLQAENLPLDDGRYFAALIDVGVRERVQVLIGDMVIWASGARSPLSARANIEVRLIQGCGDSIREGDAFDVSITAQSGLTPTSVWYRGVEHKPLRSTPSSVVFRLTYATAQFPGEVEMLVVLCGAGGQVLMKRISKHFPVSGFFRMRKGRLHSSEPIKPITRGTLLRGGYFYLPPERDDGEVVSRQDWFVMEGTRPLARFPSRGQPRYPAVGLGASLTVRRGPLNAHRDVMLAAAVTDFGELRHTHRLSLDADDALTFQVQDTLLDQLNEYSCVLWDGSGLVTSGEIVEQTPVEGGFVSVRVLANLPCSDLLAVGLCYRGIRVGAAWTESWSKYLRALVAKSPRNAAALLRWLHLPVLSPRPLTAIRHELLKEHAGDIVLGWSVAQEWKSDDGALSLAVPDAGNVQSGLLDSAWFVALREITSAWEPSPADAAHLIDAIIAASPLDDHQPTPLVAAAAQLTRIHPRFALRTLRVYVDSALAPREIAQVEQMLALRLASVSTRRELHYVVPELEEQCAQSLSALLAQPIDTAYVRGLGRLARDLGYWRGGGNRFERRPFDIEVLCHLAHGRRYLALEALGSF